MNFILIKYGLNCGIGLTKTEYTHRMVRVLTNARAHTHKHIRIRFGRGNSHQPVVWFMPIDCLNANQIKLYISIYCLIYCKRTREYGTFEGVERRAENKLWRTNVLWRLTPKARIKFYRQIHKIVINIYGNNQASDRMTTEKIKLYPFYVCVCSQTAAPSQACFTFRRFAPNRLTNWAPGNWALSLARTHTHTVCVSFAASKQHRKIKAKDTKSAFLRTQSPCTSTFSVRAFVVVVSSFGLFFLFLLRLNQQHNVRVENNLAPDFYWTYFLLLFCFCKNASSRLWINKSVCQHDWIEKRQRNRK